MTKLKKAPKRWVFGTRTNKWYLVGENDRDYGCDVSQQRMREIGRKAARNEYLSAKMV